MPKCYCRSSAAVYRPRSSPADSQAAPGGGTMPRRHARTGAHFLLAAVSPYPRALPASPDLTPDPRRAAAALLREPAAAMTGLARLFAAEGHQLALVGGMVRDVFLRRPVEGREYDLATDARPEQVRQITARWADKIWETGIEYGTIGLRKGDIICEITTYRSDKYQPASRQPEVTYGRSLEEDLARRDFTVNAIAVRLPSLELVDPFGGMQIGRA